jgi:uncharacterized protein with von Willebrand factor type A (vWA) domain
MFNNFSLRNFRQERENQRKLDQQKRHAIRDISEFESYCFDELINDDKKLQKIDEKGMEELPTFRELEEDIYSAFYRGRPEVNEDKMYKAYSLNRTILKEIMGMENYTKLRKYTKLDRETSSEVAIEMADLAIKLISEKQKEKVRQQFAKLMGGGGNGDSEGNDGEDDSQEQDGNSGGQGNSQSDEDGDQENVGLGLTEEDMQEIVDQLKAKMGQMMKDKLDKEEEKEAAVKSFGNEDGSLTTTSHEAAEQIYQKIKKSRMLYDVVKTVGRMRDIAKKIRTEKWIHVREEIYDMEQGNDISRIIASDLSLLAMDDDSPESLLALKKFADGEMLQNVYRGKEEKGKGPIVLLIDRSGSMCGTNEIWARGMALTLQHIAMEDKRDIHVVYYDHSIFREIFLPKGRPVNPDEWMNFISIGSDGGTEFTKPLDRAAEIIEKEQHMRQADVIFVSDGGFSFSGEEWLRKYKAKKEALGFKIIGILIGGGGETMKQFCEQVIDIDDVRKDSEVLNSVFSI